MKKTPKPRDPNARAAAVVAEATASEDELPKVKIGGVLPVIQAQNKLSSSTK